MTYPLTKIASTKNNLGVKIILEPKIPDKKVLELYQQGYTNKYDIAEYFGVHIRTIQRSLGRLRLRHISRFEQHLAEVWDSLLQDYLAGSTMSEVCKKYSLIDKVVRPRLKEVNVYRNEMPKHKANFDYFECISSEDKAYWLGIICADGCITGRCSLKLGVAVKDIDMLQKFNLCLDSEYPISIEENAHRNKQNFARVTISNFKLCSDLIDKGVTPRKTMTLRFPDKIPPHLVHHFIRGYFDGDGCITTNGSGHGSWSLTGTEQFLISTQNILIENCGLSRTKFTQRRKNNNVIKTMLYFGNGNITKLYNYLYNNSTIWMDRKKIKMEQFCKR